MTAQLLSLGEGPSIPLDKAILLLGRHPECDIQLNSRKISRKHCVVAKVNHYVYVRDLGSTNGVRINGQRVLEGALQAGDELTIGNFRYQICLDGALIPSVMSQLSRPKPVEPSREKPATSKAPLSDDSKARTSKPAAPSTEGTLKDSADNIVLPDILRNPR